MLVLVVLCIAVRAQSIELPPTGFDYRRSIKLMSAVFVLLICIYTNDMLFADRITDRPQ